MVLNNPTIAIIGAGNMGSALLGGLCANHYPRENLWITDPAVEKLDALKHSLHIHTTTDNEAAIKNAKVIILAVKPQILSIVLETIAATIKEQQPLIISIAAGVRIASMARYLGETIPIVRAMPNTPALINCGATGLFANSYVTAEHRAIAEKILRSVGVVVWLDDEKLLDVVTALSGSGPAYFYLVMEALQKAAIDLGLTPHAARLLTLETGYGATRMALQSELDLTNLRENVTSKGGTTEKAITILENQHIRAIFKEALIGATKRSEELATLFDQAK